MKADFLRFWFKTMRSTKPVIHPLMEMKANQNSVFVLESMLSFYSRCQPAPRCGPRVPWPSSTDLEFKARLTTQNTL